MGTTEHVAKPPKTMAEDAKADPERLWTRKTKPERRKPILVWEPDIDMDAFYRLNLARVGQPENPHRMNETMLVDMPRCVTACGRCGGVYGGSGIYRHGRCPTKRCVCKRHRASK